MYKLSFTAEALEKLFAKLNLDICSNTSIDDSSRVVVTANFELVNGSEIKFMAPADCSEITALRVYYNDNGVTTSRDFVFTDAHGCDIGDLDHLFVKDSIVKVILDVDRGNAFVQNADTNAYLEEYIASKLDATEVSQVIVEALAQAKADGELTPVRGVDYWTEADKEEIKSYVDNAILGGAW